MQLDLRWPIGIMFALLGALLVLFGALAPAASTSVGININLIWGSVLLAFGLLMLAAASRARKPPPHP